MAKAKTIYFCQECGYESAKWMGQCPSCKAWNTFVEEYVETSTKKGAKAKKALAFPTNIVEVSTKEEERISTHMKELDRVLNGGIVRGSLSLVGGDPGIGKSTLLLQVCRNLANAGRKVLYVSGEESLHQIKMRASRIGEFQGELMLLCETDMDAIVDGILKLYHNLLLILMTINKKRIVW